MSKPSSKPSPAETAPRGQPTHALVPLFVMKKLTGLLERHPLPYEDVRPLMDILATVQCTHIPPQDTRA